MRILNVTAQKPDSTGSGVYLAEMVRCELAAGNEAAVVCGIDVSDAPQLPEGAHLFPVRFNTPELPFNVCGMSDQMPYAATRYRDMTPSMVQQFRRAFATVLKRAIDKFAPDIVVCHHLYLLTALVREVVSNCPVFAICHATDLRQMRTHALERDAIVRDIRSLDGIFTLHEGQISEIVEIYGCDADKIRVLGTGYNAQLFHFPEQTRRRCATNEPAQILYVGKIWEKKGVGCLLKALDACDFGPQGAQVKLVGGHNDEGEYLRFRERAAQCRVPVEFLGKLSPEELAPLYQAADVFVLPSFFEGLPLVVVEALACGCRVVVTDLPGIRPWLSRYVPTAPIVYVKPPRMEGADTPVSDDLPAFERRLARALEEALALPSFEGDMSELAWEGLEARFERLVKGMMARHPKQSPQGEAEGSLHLT